MEAQFDYSLDKGTVGNIIRRNRARVVGSEAELEATEAHVANRVESFIHVQATTDSEGMDVLPHISASLTWPIHLCWEVQNRGDRTVRYMQLNVWLPHGMFWDPETPNQTLWEEQGGDQLTGSLKLFHEINDFHIGTLFNRWLIRLPPGERILLDPERAFLCLTTDGCDAKAMGRREGCTVESRGAGDEARGGSVAALV